jgi:hypothetical protein
LYFVSLVSLLFFGHLGNKLRYGNTWTHCINGLIRLLNKVLLKDSEITELKSSRNAHRPSSVTVVHADGL